MPDNTSFNESLEKGTILGDGAMGTLLYQMAMKHDTKPVEELCLSRPDSVRLAHIEYIRSGATMIQTNTFAANRDKLASYGMMDSTSLINKAGIEIAKEARRLTGQQVWIAGSVGPIGRHLEPIGAISLVSARKFFQEQVDALAEGGADLIILETFSDLREVELAATAATSACLPFIAQMAFGHDGLTSLGHSPGEAAAAMESMGAAVVGCNCSVGAAPMVSTVSQMMSRVSIPISAQPNAGFPTMHQGRTVFGSSPEYMASQAMRLVDAGASLVGGCCGTSPTHISAIRDSIPTRARPKKDQLPSRRITISTREPFLSSDNEIPEPSTFSTKLKEHKKVITMEVDPPRGFRASSELSQLEQIRNAGVLDAINIADNPRAQRRMSPLAMATLVQNRLGMETIMHLALRHRNYASLHSDLIGAHALGIQNIFTVMGDKPRSDNYVNPYTPSNLTTTGALNLMKSFNGGLDLSGEPLESPTAFLKGASFNPTAKDPDREFRLLESKLEAGADFLLTQPVYDSAAVQKTAQKFGGFPIPVLIGILPLRSKRNAEFLQNEVPGISIPPEIMEAISSSSDPRRTGMDISRRIVTELSDTVSGVYYMAPFRRYESIIEFTESLDFG